MRSVALGLLAACALSQGTLAASALVPVVIWHGLGDRWDAAGMIGAKTYIQEQKELEGIFVHLVRVKDDGAADQKASFFGRANDQVEHVCEQLASIPEITSPLLNPSGMFDGVGFSQGGQLMRAVAERCRTPHLKMRNLITLGSQHLGIADIPPCPPEDGPFTSCRLMHLGIVREGLYSPWAQNNLVPAQYFRNPARIDDYLRVNEFLRDINNERQGDAQPYGGTSLVGDEVEPRNATYKASLTALQAFVMIRFSREQTVIPPHSAHFELPEEGASCPPTEPACYVNPVPWSKMPLYTEDYIGLRTLNEAGKITRGICDGAHMQIDEDCLDYLITWLGDSGDKKSGSKSALKVQGY